MNITITGTAYPYRGGLAAYNERLAKQFIDEGHDVKLLTFTLQYPDFLFPGKSQYLDGPSPDRLNIERKVNSINPINWISTGFKIKKLKPDLLIFKYWIPFMAPCFGTIARIAKSNRHTKVICILDNVIPHEKRPGDKFLTTYFTGCIDGAIAMSQSVLNDLQQFRRDVPVKLSPHPLFDNFGDPAKRAEALSELGLDADYSYLLFFGFIRAYKGLDLLIEAFADNRLRDRKLKLLIAGEFYEDAKPYLNLIKRYNLDNEIILFDRFINDSEVNLFFSVSDLIVQPYRSATQSGVTQIAYHFEKPMLVTDVGGLKEIVPHGLCGYVVNTDPKEIADSITDFYENRRQDTFVQNVKKEKEKYSWSKMTESVIEVYKKCIENDNKK
ncbi:MAG: glycosyl transferase family 1 [Odoribacter sp.]|nr:glycosyl transferase family 1 [Odoribacter sp.]